MILPAKTDPMAFDWLSWCAGSIHELGIECRYHDITSTEGKYLLRRHTIGYCPGHLLYCRPKDGQVAVMVLVEERMFWFHIAEREFREVFPELSETPSKHITVQYSVIRATITRGLHARIAYRAFNEGHDVVADPVPVVAVWGLPTVVLLKDAPESREFRVDGVEVFGLLLHSSAVLTVRGL